MERKVNSHNLFVKILSFLFSVKGIFSFNQVEHLPIVLKLLY